METQKNALYYAHILIDPEFSLNELNLLNIYFMSGLDKLNETIERAGIKVTNASQLADYGYVLSHVGKLGQSGFVIYPMNVNFGFVSDILNKKNFYSISKTTESGQKVIFEKVHLREQAIEEDLKYYIELDIQFEMGPYPVFSEYIQ